MQTRYFHPLVANTISRNRKLDAINSIKDLKNKVGALQAKAANSKKNGPQSSGADVDATIDPVIANDTNKIAKLTADFLTVKAEMQWDPQPATEHLNISSSNKISTNIDGSPLVKVWFNSKASTEEVSQVLQKSELQPALQMELDFKSWSKTVGTVTINSSSVDGLVLRNPALATLKICKGACTADEHDKLQDTTQVVAKVDSLSIPQFGSRMIIPFKDGWFQDVGLNLTMGPDGSITNVGTQNAGTAATTVGAINTDAQSAVTGVGARNTAITASNTAAQAVVGYADLMNKSLADCLTQQKTALGLGGSPAKCQ